MILSYIKTVKIDAKNQPIGRVASEAAKYLIGKNDFFYNPAQSAQIKVIIENADKAIFTGNKSNTIIYRSHSGRPGGEKLLSYNQIRDRKPKLIFERAIRGMLPKNKLGRKLFNNLEINFSEI